MTDRVIALASAGAIGRLRHLAAESQAAHLVRTGPGRALVGAVAAIALVTAIGLAILWPSSDGASGPARIVSTKPATVKRVMDRPCANGDAQLCRRIVVSVDGTEANLGVNLARLSPDLKAGDSVRVRPLAGAGAGAAGAHYEFVEPDRRGSLLWIGVAVVLLAVLLLRWRGVLAVIGVALSVMLVIRFLVPAIVAGEPALLVALVAALTVMFVTLVLTNGVGAQTFAAALGIAATLVFAAGAAALAVHAADLGATGDDTTLASVGARDGSLSLGAITIAAMLVGALGVLADTAVTQASAVMQLRRADPGLTGRGLYSRAFVIGRDHVSATIHTLVLAYAGAALPLLLIFNSSSIATVDALNDQAVAEPIVATLIGCLALLVAVPVSTGLASFLVARLPADGLGDVHHHH